MDHRSRALVAIVAWAWIANLFVTKVDGGRFAESDERLGTRVAPLLLLARPDVQIELKLTPGQVASAEAIMDSLHAQAESLQGRGNGPDVVARRRVIDETQRNWLTTELTGRQQLRLLQLDLQWEGPSALISRPSVVEALGLSSDQAEAIAKLKTERDKARLDPTVRRQAEQRFAKAALAVLTPDQRERWKAMLGEPFQVQTQDATRRKGSPQAPLYERSDVTPPAKEKPSE